MRKRHTRIVVILLMLATGLIGTFVVVTTRQNSSIWDENRLVSVESPQQQQPVRSPLIVTGRARGAWYFEATFPVKLLDDRGNEVASGHAQALGDWMSEEFVPFRAELIFEMSGSSAGLLILEKSNPSGLAEHAAQLEIPIRFDVDE